MKTFYASIGGNYDEAVSRMMNDMFIAKLVAKFFNNNTYNDIISSYEAKDYTSLFAHIHAFKGVTGNLALASLFEISSILTEATRSGEVVNIDNEINTLKERYQLFLDSYNKYLI